MKVPLPTSIVNLVTIATLFLATILPPPVIAAEPKACKIAHDAIEQASKIRRLKIRRKVPCLVHNKSQVKKYLLHAIKTKLPPDRLKV
ncbi:MAG: hypothetical protein D6719_09500, partial [Candidatus Dadabacteria bacterium]